MVVGWEAGKCVCYSPAPPKKDNVSSYPKPVNIVLYDKKDFTDVIKERILRCRSLSWIPQVAPTCSCEFLRRGTFDHRQKRRRRGDKGSRDCSNVATSQWKRKGMDSSPETAGWSMALPTP